MNGSFDHAFRITLRTLALCVWLAASAVYSPSNAQSNAINTTASRQAIEEASRADCEGVSVVVRRCVAQPDANRADKSDDSLTRSRARTKAAFDRRDRRARQDALEGNAATNDRASDARAQRLAPVTVTGNAAEPPPSIEQILQRALNPQAISPNGTVTSYAPDGARVECIARCVGPMCCLTLRNRPDPARESNSIGR